MDRLSLNRPIVVILDYAVVDLRRLCPPVTVVKRRDGLREDLPYEVLADGVLSFPAPSDELLQVSSVTVLHDYVYFCLLLVDYSVKVLDDVGVAEFPKYVDLRDYLLLLFLAHNAIVQLFPDQSLLVTYSAHFLNFPKRSYRLTTS